MPEFIARPNIPNSLAALLTELIAKEPSPAGAAIGAVKDIALGGLEGLAKSRAKAEEMAAKKKEQDFKLNLAIQKILTKGQVDQDNAILKNYIPLITAIQTKDPNARIPTREQYLTVAKGGTITKPLGKGVQGPEMEEIEFMDALREAAKVVEESKKKPEEAPITLTKKQAMEYGLDPDIYVDRPLKLSDFHAAQGAEMRAAGQKKMQITDELIAEAPAEYRKALKEAKKQGVPVSLALLLRPSGDALAAWLATIPGLMGGAKIHIPGMAVEEPEKPKPADDQKVDRNPLKLKIK